MIGISACLGGIACRYDGKSQSRDELVELVENKKAEMICPEVLGGLPIPRKPAEIIGGDGYNVLEGKARVLDIDGEDVTSIYLAGAEKAYDNLKSKGINVLIVKENSPSCGSQFIYDGTFTGCKISGIGVATAFFKSKGLKVYSDTELEEVKMDYPNFFN
ncbi:DUF523 domain-containing protein [Vagococcus carniphilus]|uniref:Uncharacterized protein n=1 Tax=Vagococcus carniphilus TaxID=218144 RepID=A0A430ATF7_9ENTE|nr:DUF523 domain-containing protein [Vagococcus carniphilus]QNN73295.1 DUF523 domain-containing protein [Vagococcus carniphilus]RSU11342.1 hypothetical protein CBF28_12230 [Vagococcus carniphilus]